MILRATPAVALAIVAALASPARADSAAPTTSPPTTSPPTDADILFTAGKMFRDSGLYAAACSKFEQTKQLAPGIGVSLYLADCYAHIGRAASAWKEFKVAEKLAADKGDKRAQVAHARADEIEPKIARIRIAAPAGGGVVEIDGARITERDWSAGVPVDPGDRRVAFVAPGSPRRALTAHVDSSARSVLVRIEAPPKYPAARPSPPPAPPPTPVAPPPEPAPAGSADARRWTELGLLGLGAAGVGIGAGLLAEKNHSMTNSLTGPQSDQGPTIGSAVAFSLGGAAIVAAVVVYLAAPNERETTSVRLTPAAIGQGGGAFLTGSF